VNEFCFCLNHRSHDFAFERIVSFIEKYAFVAGNKQIVIFLCYPPEAENPPQENR
jgi:hypothetical protein